MDRETDLIRRFFSRAPADDGLLRGIGDDAALLRIDHGEVLAVSTDVLVAGRHFPQRCDPAAIGHKALAVNLSDLAATGARPRWSFLCLTLPAADTEWLDAFSRGFFALADRYQVVLAGGDTTEGPLTVGVTICGTVPADAALSRAGVMSGDDIWVTGELGGAALAFHLLSGDAPAAAEAWRDRVMPRLLTPEPRVDEGLALRGIAGGCTDLSDGLARNMALMLDASGWGAEIELAELPLAPALQECVPIPDAWHMAVGFGDDYELCFTASPDHRRHITDALPATRIGRVIATPGIRWLPPDGAAIDIHPTAHHFSGH